MCSEHRMTAEIQLRTTSAEKNNIYQIIARGYTLGTRPTSVGYAKASHICTSFAAGGAAPRGAVGAERINRYLRTPRMGPGDWVLLGCCYMYVVVFESPSSLSRCLPSRVNFIFAVPLFS